MSSPYSYHPLSEIDKKTLEWITGHEKELEMWMQEKYGIRIHQSSGKRNLNQRDNARVIYDERTKQYWNPDSRVTGSYGDVGE